MMGDRRLPPVPVPSMPPSVPIARPRVPITRAGNASGSSTDGTVILSSASDGVSSTGNTFLDSVSGLWDSTLVFLESNTIFPIFPNWLTLAAGLGAALAVKAEFFGKRRR